MEKQIYQIGGDVNPIPHGGVFFNPATQEVIVLEEQGREGSDIKVHTFAVDLDNLADWRPQLESFTGAPQDLCGEHNQGMAMYDAYLYYGPDNVGAHTETYTEAEAEALLATYQTW